MTRWVYVYHSFFIYFSLQNHRLLLGSYIISSYLSHFHLNLNVFFLFHSSLLATLCWHWGLIREKIEWQRCMLMTWKHWSIPHWGEIEREREWERESKRGKKEWEWWRGGGDLLKCWQIAEDIWAAKKTNMPPENDRERGTKKERDSHF